MTDLPFFIISIGEHLFYTLAENELMHFFENVETVDGVRIKTKTDEYSFLKENINDFDTIDKRWEFESKLDRSKFYIDSTSVSGIDGCYIKIAKKLAVEP